MGRRRYTVVDELRQATRFTQDAETEMAIVWQRPGEKMLVPVHDESLGGMGLIMDDVTMFQRGQEARILYSGSEMTAVVRHIEPLDDGKFLVGFECERPR